jgi:hypothetical protein
MSLQVPIRLQKGSVTLRGILRRFRDCGWTRPVSLPGSRRNRPVSCLQLAKALRTDLPVYNR